jgi:hypothetical protein
MAEIGMSPLPTRARAFTLRGKVVPVSVALLLPGAVALLGWFQGARMSLLLVIGAMLGITLFHSSFSFAAAWRAFVLRGEGGGMRAQLLFLAIASVLVLPALSGGQVLGHPVTGSVAPVSVSLLAGACLFGFGMQLGGGCGSGTLYTAGSGNVRMMVTLAFFVVGSLLATAHVPWWFARPSIDGIALIDHVPATLAIALQLAVLGMIAIITQALEPLGPRPQRVPPPRRGWSRVVRGPWSLAHAALALGALEFVTLLVAGHPWSITYGFTLWGAELATVLGIDVASWEFWNWPYHRQALAAGSFANTTSVMDMGLLLGALLAAVLSGRTPAAMRVPLRSLAAAAIGGLLMGYGARLSFGCNIGAFVAGVISTSAHGWVWFIAALAGTALGGHVRPLFGLSR